MMAVDERLKSIIQEWELIIDEGPPSVDDMVFESVNDRIKMHSKMYQEKNVRFEKLLSDLSKSLQEKMKLVEQMDQIE